MAGPSHSFPSGFPNAQQGGMRGQFGAAQGANTSNEKKGKVQEHLKTIRLLFKRLRLIYEKCNENCQGMEYTHIESLIPLKEEWDMKSDEKKTSESYRLVCEENKEVMEQLPSAQLSELKLNSEEGNLSTFRDHSAVISCLQPEGTVDTDNDGL
ncbi:unnamed protein product [Timema podura]|uniref:Mediator of RNA polymerase II transcription subunit 30 n=1 Tax=Timema podura TaxID=61482 RepID=A0ABN7NPZ5_TIMPD|nr:unnamed protein product [Timema podura]